MSYLQNPFLIAVFIIIVYFILKLIYRILVKPKLKLSKKVKIKADKKYEKLLAKFKKLKKRSPNKNDKFRLIINASHITIRRKGIKGHWGRQKVRKYLLEKHKVVDKYKMR
ncbi:hypothetical protein COV13_01670 [Candidatus Woesearchaeota archaeon CG10_big_fil_rev_8_21_14_0_10_32_9]|nr:MAG: hypothetical protein COV13_01670 [Candidatus Woesearchaeota archaeon CG10_big_fil_rev_8_21_14_0_10_32_9]